MSCLVKIGARCGSSWSSDVVCFVFVDLFHKLKKWLSQTASAAQYLLLQLVFCVRAAPPRQAAWFFLALFN
jgi:hypothetical protein